MQHQFQLLHIIQNNFGQLNITSKVDKTDKM